MRTYRKKIKRNLAQLFRTLDIPILQYPALDNLDKKLVSTFQKKTNGVFVEAGANDGYDQSNTYYLEKHLGWTGLLVEPVPDLFNQCKKIRNNSVVENYALTSFGDDTEFINMESADLMSIVVNNKYHQSQKDKFDKMDIGKNTKIISVPCEKLNNLLKKNKIKKNFDLLSLDVEGYESNVLAGIDFEEFRPKYILVEVRDELEIENLLQKYYVKHTTLYQNSERKDNLYILR